MYSLHSLYRDHAQTLILVNLLLVDCLGSLTTLLETVFSVFDHIWSQDSPTVPLTLGGKTVPYIDQGGSTIKV